MKICPMCGASYDDASVFCSVDGAALRSLADGNDLIHTVIADRYLITRKLGEGGMGRVYLAKHVRLPQSWAIKILDPTLVRDTGSLARFNQEAASASRIENRHVARVIDFGETGDGLLYLAMEYVDGEALSKVIEREGRLDPVRAADITSQVAEALGAAHELGIVHRDLKPDNIMVGSGRGGVDDVKVVDFGIAKVIHDEGEKVTKTGFVIGTPEYMSPEQISAGDVDGRSDVYSLALVAFRMLTGKLPFPADTPQESMFMRVTNAPRTLVEMFPDPGWPAEVQVVLDRGLAREPEDRYASAVDFSSALSTAVAAWRSGGVGGASAAGQSEHIETSTSRTAPARQERAAAPPPQTTARRSPTLVRGIMLLGLAAVIGLGGYFVAGSIGARNAIVDSVASRAGPGDAGPPPSPSPSPSPAATGDTVAGGSSPTLEALPPAPGAGATTARDSTGAKSKATPSPDPTAPSRLATERTPGGGGEGGGAAAGSRAAPTSASSPAGARRELDKLQNIIEDLTETNARRLLASIPAALPRLATSADTVEAWYYALQADVLLNDIPAACDVIGRIGRDARTTPFAAPLQVFGDSLRCR